MLPHHITASSQHYKTHSVVYTFMCWHSTFIDKGFIGAKVHIKVHADVMSLRGVQCDVCWLQCRALTACVMWEITMQDLQPIVDWQEDVAEILVRTTASSCDIITRQSAMQHLETLWVAMHSTGVLVDAVRVQQLYIGLC